MYVDPFWLGVASVIGLELLIVVSVAVVSSIHDKLKERRK